VVLHAANGPLQRKVLMGVLLQEFVDESDRHAAFTDR
jgi:hypothetical protein